jgi:hypothetical protein
MGKFKHTSVEDQMKVFNISREAAEEKIRTYREKLTKRKTCKGKTANPYSVEYQMQRYSLTQDEAILKISALKKSVSQSYSVEYQMQRHDLTLCEAEEKIAELKKKTASGHLISDPAWQMKRFGLTLKEAEEKIKMAFDKRKDSYIKIKKTDPKRWNAIRKSNKEYWIKRGVSDHDAQQKVDEFLQNMRNVFIESMKDPAYAHKHFTKTVKYKDYLMPSGNNVKIQGYEPQVLTELLKKYKEEDIVIGEKNIFNAIGRISYKQHNIEHSYYPDFYIKSTNTIIEVKSQYTYDNWQEKNELKKQVCLDNGFNFEFMIWNPKTQTITN